MEIIHRTINLLFSSLFKEGEEAAEKLHEVKDQLSDDQLNSHKRVLSSLIWFTWLFPILFLIIIISGDGFVINIVGSIIAFLIAILFLFALPVGMLSDKLFKGSPGSRVSADYFRNTLTIELCVILSIWVIPAQYSFSNIFPVLIGALLLGMLGVLVFSRSIFSVLIAITILFLIRCYFSPGSCPNIVYWMAIIKDSLLESYLYVGAVLFVGLLLCLLFNMKVIGIVTTMAAAFLIYCSIFPEQMPVVGDKIMKIESNVAKRIEMKIESNVAKRIEKKVTPEKSIKLTSSPNGADVYVNGIYSGNTQSAKISEKDVITKRIVLKIAGYKERKMDRSDIRDGKIFITLEENSRGQKN